MRELWDDAPWWAVGYDVFGRIETFDPADTRQEALTFIDECLPDCSMAAAMTRKQLERALREEAREMAREEEEIWRERQFWD